MADLARLESALRNADAAGDSQGAAVIANAIREQMGTAAPVASDMQAVDSPTDRTGLLDKALTMGTNLIDGVPIVGGPLRKAGQYGRAAVETTVGDFMRGEDTTFSEALDNVQNENSDRDAQNANLATGSQIASSLASTGAGAMTQIGSRALGLTGKTLGKRVANSAASGAGISGADTLTRGGDAGDVALSAGIGGGVAGAVPLVGAGLRRGIEKAADSKNLGRAATKVRDAIKGDRAVGGRVLSDADVEFAAKEGLPIINADRGGEATRSLMISAANTGTEANQIITSEMADRFAGQSGRLLNLVKGSAPSTNAVNALDDLKAAASKANRPAYEKAFSGNFKDASGAELAPLMDRVPASAMRDAMKVAKSEGRPFGQQLVANIDDATDKVTFSREPSLREWHYIQRGLRSAGDKAYRSGSSEVGTSYKGLHREILNGMDNANPDYKTARQGAAAFFGQEDALEAGRSFAKSRGKLAEFSKAMEQLKTKPAERKLFQVGYANELVDRISTAGDSVDVVKQTFGNPAARAKFKAVFGAKKARKMEATVRVEAAMNLTKQALGRSTTTKQLVELGLTSGGIGAGAGFYSGDWQTGIVTALGTAGVRKAGSAVNKKIAEGVQRQVAEILTSADPKKIDSLIRKASVEPQWLGAVDMYSRALAISGGVAASRAAN